MIATHAGNNASARTEARRCNCNRRHITTKALQVLLTQWRGLIELDQRLAQRQDLGPLRWRWARHARYCLNDE